MAKEEDYSDEVETAWRLLRRLSVEDLHDLRERITEHIGPPPTEPGDDPSLGVREPRNPQLPSGETGAVQDPEPEPEPVEAVAAVVVVPDTQLDEPYLEITPKRKPGRPRKSEQP